MILRLDCESPSAAAESLAAILGTQRATLEAQLMTFEESMWESFEADYPLQDPDYYLRDWVLDTLHTTISRDWAHTYYFHLTRTLDPCAFMHGIEPLRPPLIDRIWAMLYPLVEYEITPEQWGAFRTEMETTVRDHHAELYRMKTEEPEWHGGPYGLLVREQAFHARAVSNHDYLRTPEIVEDIGFCFQDRFGVDLNSRFYNISQPAIVKFCVVDAKVQTVAMALNYLWTKLHGGEDSGNSVWSYDARGQLIPPAQIDYIECPPGNRVGCP